MNKKVKSFTLSLILIISYLALFDTVIELVIPIHGTILYVNTTGSNGAYPHIQWAIDNASDGDTVYVYSGIYYENVIINKTISLIGEDRNTTIIDGYSVGYVVRLMNADYINISNFGIRKGETGIRIDFSTSHYDNISWNHVYDIFSINDVYGIEGGAFNNIHHNIVHNISTNGTDRDATGIGAGLSDNVTHNTVFDIYSDTWHAVGIGVGDSNNISFNNIYNISTNGTKTGPWENDPRAIGIFVTSSENNITSNYVHDVFTTNVQNNFAGGIFLYGASNNNIISNHVYHINSSYDVVWGICLRESSNFNNLISNRVFNLSSPNFAVIGIFAISTSNYNNFISNYVFNLTRNRVIIGILTIDCSYNNLISNHVFNINTSSNISGDVIGIEVSIVLNYGNKILSNHVHDIHSKYAPTTGIRIGGQSGYDTSSNVVYNISCENFYAAGIRAIGSSNFNNITSNSIRNIESTNFDAYGILLEWAETLYNNITENNITNVSGGRAGYGIFLNESCNYNNLTANKINNVTSVSGIAYGIDLRDASHNIIDNCSINNTQTGVHFDEQSINNTFINSSITNTDIFDFYFDDVLGGESNAITLNTTFNKTRVFYEDTLSNLTVKWFMHVRVIYLNGTPVKNAYIWVNDSYGVPIFEGQADANGWVRWLMVTEYIEQNLNGDHSGERAYFTPHDITATDGELWGYVYPTMDISKVVTVILGLPTLLPPTNLTTKVVENGTAVELEWDPPFSLSLHHYLIYRADSATEFNFTRPYNSSITWQNPKNTTWIDPDPNVTALNDDLYYIVRAANADESDISMTSNTAGTWTRTFQEGTSTFSLPLEPFIKSNVEFYCQDMNASYIKWMNMATHTWMRHERGGTENITHLEIGRGYEIGFVEETRFTFTGMPGAMIRYDDVSFGFDASSLGGDADSLTASADASDTVTLNWLQPENMGLEDGYYVLRSNKRNGFWGTLGLNYTVLSILSFDILSYQDFGNASDGTEYYYIIVPVNLSTGEKGSSSYSIGVHTVDYLDQYDTFALPLKLNSLKTADWYCDNINNSVGINYFNESNQRWEWHSRRMPANVYDPIIKVGLGYQLSTTIGTKFSFIGV